MTYFESAEGETINRKRVIAEFDSHGLGESDWTEFFEGFPTTQDMFNAQDVLRFIGY